MMLLSQSLVKLLQTWDSGLLEDLPADLVSEQIPIVLTQILFRTLQLQSFDGSWCFNDKPSREITAYAVLTLKSLSSLPWLAEFQPRVQAAIEHGSAYLAANRDLWHQNEHIWVAKVTYALPPVARAYNIAAIGAKSSHSWGDKVRNLITLSPKRVREFARFLSSLPMFCEDQLWALEGDVTLGYLYQPQLLRISSTVFPPQSKAENKYLEYIPLTWIVTNRRNHYTLPNSALWEMMVISVLIYQLDEFMEAVCSKHAGAELDTEQLRQIILELCEFDAERSAGPNGPLSNGAAMDVTNGNIKGNGVSNCGQDALSQARSTLHRFTSHILHHSAVVQSPANVRKQLHDQLAACLLTHIDHEEDSARFAAQQQQEKAENGRPQGITPFAPPPGTYYSWMRTTAADNTQSPAIFQFFCCLAAAPGDEPFFRGARQHYLASALSSHLAKLCRQYNDYGSASRDSADGNLNSLNFPEFHELPGSVDDMKADLFFIAEYERECLNHAVARLAAEVGEKKMAALQVFIDTVDLYGQIYVARDISNRLRAPVDGNELKR